MSFSDFLEHQAHTWYTHTHIHTFIPHVSKIFIYKKINIKNLKIKLGMVVHVFNHSTGEAEAGRSM